jgi:uncharacterized secreted protein with C-terminal beta-propeller domain
VIDGIDGPRPLPPELRDRLVASIVAAAGPLAGIDAPRPLPPSARRRLESVLSHKRDLQRRVLAVAVVLVLLAGVAAATTRDEKRRSSTAFGGTPMERPLATTTTTLAGGAVGALASSEPVLVKLDFKQSCGELLDYLKTNGAERVTAFGLGGIRSYGGDAIPVADQGGSAGGMPSSAAATSASTTNNQEQGVDEPDVVQNDGRFIYALSGISLRVVDAGSSPPQLVASLALPQVASNMLLAGDRLLVIGYDFVVHDPDTGAGHSATMVTTVDVSDPTAPSVADSIELDGYLVSTRMVDGLARVVTSSGPTVPVEQPADGSAEALDAALVANRASVARSTITQWIGDRPCSSVGLPSEFSGFDMTSVYTVDPHALSASHSASVAAGGEMVYASTANLYVTSMRWDAWQVPAADVAVLPDTHTQVHQFDISGRGSPTYVASGQIDGYILNQYSLSELDGNLRVATTNSPTWLERAASSESAVTVLAVLDGQLRPIGSVGGLGAGEAIQGVRFVGDIGFVVTFLRTDPLYVVDLRDPTQPTVRGALEVTGFSSYLHPIDPGFLVGVGSSADETGRTTGAQVSVFDVRNLDEPSLVSRLEFLNEFSQAASDPHAFLYWAPRSLVVIPLQGPEPATVLMVADGSGVVEVGRVSQPAYADRSLVIGDTLYTISSYAGVQATNLDTLADEGSVAFPTQ